MVYAQSVLGRLRQPTVQLGPLSELVFCDQAAGDRRPRDLVGGVHWRSNRTGGFRRSFRISVGITLLVWFAYFANRPDPEYMCSYLLLYGLLLIDLGRCLAAGSSWHFGGRGCCSACRSSWDCWFSASRAGGFARVLEWTGYPFKFTVKSTRFERSARRGE